jgi:hypothetical protein
MRRPVMMSEMRIHGGSQQAIAQQTPAVQAMLAPWMNGGRVGSSSPRRKRRAVRVKTKRTKRRASSSKRSKKPARLVKGSAAAKRYMASIRRKRRK